MRFARKGDPDGKDDPDKRAINTGDKSPPTQTVDGRRSM